MGKNKKEKRTAFLSKDSEIRKKEEV